MSNIWNTWPFGPKPFAHRNLYGVSPQTWNTPMFQPPQVPTPQPPEPRFNHGIKVDPFNPVLPKPGSPGSITYRRPQEDPSLTGPGDLQNTAPPEAAQRGKWIPQTPEEIPDDIRLMPNYGPDDFKRMPREVTNAMFNTPRSDLWPSIWSYMRGAAFKRLGPVPGAPKVTNPITGEIDTDMLHMTASADTGGVQIPYRSSDIDHDRLVDENRKRIAKEKWQECKKIERQISDLDLRRSDADAELGAIDEQIYKADELKNIIDGQLSQLAALAEIVKNRN